METGVGLSCGGCRLRGGGREGESGGGRKRGRGGE